MNRSYEITSWRPGTLRPYESIASIGAKYCYLNRVKPIKFYQLIYECIGLKSSFDSNDITFDDHSFDFKKFSETLSEPLSVTKKLSLTHFKKLANLSSQTRYEHRYNEDFCYCKLCLQNGYHSPIHQLTWVKRCFIHNEPLQKEINKIKAVKHLAHDIKFFNKLYDVWFLNNNIWQSAKSFDWVLLDNDLIAKKAKALMDALMCTEIAIQQPLRVIGRNFENNLFSLTNHKNINNNILRSVMLNGDFYTSKIFHINCSKRQADLILDLNSEDFHTLIFSRQISPENKDAIWQTLLLSIQREMLKGHVNCLKKFKRSFEDLEILRVRWCASHQSYVHPPYEPSRYQDVPCPRITSIYLLQSLLNIQSSVILAKTESFNMGIEDITHLSTAIHNSTDLEATGLIEKWRGQISLDNHSLVQGVLRDLFPLALEETDRAKQVFLIKPKGPLLEIIDYYFYKLISVWAWSISDTEAQGKHQIEKSWDPVEHLKNNLWINYPSLVMGRSQNGLRANYGTRFLSTLPKWSTKSDNNILTHQKLVSKRCKELSLHFDKILLERILHAELMARVKAYRLFNDH